MTHSHSHSSVSHYVIPIDSHRFCFGGRFCVMYAFWKSQTFSPFRFFNLDFLLSFFCSSFLLLLSKQHSVFVKVIWLWKWGIRIHVTEYTYAEWKPNDEHHTHTHTHTKQKTNRPKLISIFWNWMEWFWLDVGDKNNNQINIGKVINERKEVLEI